MSRKRPNGAPLPRNLSYPTLTTDTAAAERDTLIALFGWAEERTQLTIDWYLWRKTSRARWSKACRGAAILLGVGGGVVPLLHAAWPGGPGPEWGFVLLAVAGGFVLADRIFGFSSSWTRFMRTQATLQTDLARAQARFLSWRGALPDGATVPPDAAAEVIAIASELIEKTTTVVFQETASWADDLAVQIEQANARLVLGPQSTPTSAGSASPPN
ncbi:SLATT domain-containing protein [Micromonospora sp. NPDC049523]|uniref:SLATT domain-containing protein n=1 Tax=Micromonospora sp. NPDC049523 TaxID=3155921 RepID=UPI003414136F